MMRLFGTLGVYCAIPGYVHPPKPTSRACSGSWPLRWENIMWHGLGTSQIEAAKWNSSWVGLNGKANLAERRPDVIKYMCSCCTMLHTCVNVSIDLLWTFTVPVSLLSCQFWEYWIKTVNINNFSASTIVVLFHSAPSAKPGARKGVFTGDHHPTDWATSG